jgi:threonine/homoserine/homoserine lactone efflux protein
MFDSFGNMPAHPLLVHIPVVVLFFAAIGVVAMAIRPSWLRTYGVIVTALAGIGFVGSVLAASSGEALEDDLRETGIALSPKLLDHVEMGESVRLVSGLFFLATLAWVLFSAWRRRVGEEQATAKARKPRVIATVLMALAILLGAGSAISVTRTGHSGAQSVWEE